MIQESFATRMQLKPADVVVVPKSEINIVEHYIVYFGTDALNQHWYLENNHQEGVRWLSEMSFIENNKNYKRIRLFQGTEQSRSAVVQRAVSLVGQKYDLGKFNCENYANYVQFGVSESKQVNNAGGIILGGLLLLGLFASGRR